MVTVETKVRELAKSLLEEGKIDYLIGYEEGTLPLSMTPCFIQAPEEVSRLVYNPFCVQNLAKYVTDVIFSHRENQRRVKPEERAKKVVGVVARGCTSRSIVIHLLERQYDREEVVIIGVPCDGYVDMRKLKAHLDGKEIVAGEVKDGTLLVETGEGRGEVILSQVLSDNCLVCRYNNPVIYDYMVGELVAPRQGEEEFQVVAEFSQLSDRERWEYFTREMAKCIRCYACRNACPSCYCRSCFVEQTTPRWIGLTVDPSDVQLFQLMRLFHMVGRCVDCGSCSAVCPMGVDLRTFLKKIDYDGWKLFKNRPGVSLEEPLLLGTFSESDPEDFIFHPK